MIGQDIVNEFICEKLYEIESQTGSFVFKNNITQEQEELLEMTDFLLEFVEWYNKRNESDLS